MRRRLLSAVAPFAPLIASFSAASCARPAAAAQGEVASRAEAIGTSTAQSQSRELTADQQVLHALSRLTFGARPGDAERVRAVGVDKWIAEQLRPEQIDDRATADFLARYQTLGMRPSELYREFPPAAVVRAIARRDSTRPMSRSDSLEIAQQLRRNNTFVAELNSARAARAVMSERQLQEVMVDFWLNHFSVFAGKGQTRYFLTSYERDAIRPNALGNFRELLGAVAKSPAMLFYLDNVQSVADSGRETARANRGARPGNRRRPGVRPRIGPQRTPQDQQAQQRRPRGLNENYARELMELHTLGVDGGYTQNDVVNVARALTGWGIRPALPAAVAADPRASQRAQRAARLLAAGGEPGTFVFRPEVHDAEEKIVLGRKLEAGRGIEDGEAVLDILARHPSTAKFIAHKLAVRFVSDEPPQALVDRAAATFTRTNGNIREVVRTIVTSPEFFSAAAFRAKVKSPFEVVVSTLRAINAAPDPTPRTAQIIARLGQPIFGRQTPDGWPETGSEWMNTGAILNRINFGMAVAANRVPGVRLDRWPAASKLRDATRGEQVDGVVSALLGGHVSPDTRAILTSGDHPFLARAAADSSADPLREESDSTGTTVNDMAGRPRQRGGMRGGGAGGFRNVGELTGIAQVVGLALGSPEFQRR